MNNISHFCVLDIETSTLYNTMNEPCAVWLSYGYINIYDKNGDNVENFPFRTWSDLDIILSSIEQRYIKRKIYCYSHNLAYEFDYLIKNISKPKNFLVNNSHAVISTVLEKHPQFEFRCSYRLSGKSLSKLGDEIGLKKLDDPYTMILPNDEIPQKRWEYCLRDCDIVAKYIAKKIKEYKLLSNIPLTKTGEVRYIYKKYYNQYVNDLGHEPIWDLMPDEDCYNAELRAFCGGITISNPMFTGIVLRDVVSYDIKSSYPYALLQEEFPYTIKKYNGKLITDLLSNKFWIAKIRFNNIQSLYDWGWLSRSKMDDYSFDKSEWFNGKLIFASYIERTICNIDFESIKLTYKFDSYELLEFYKMDYYGYIPKPYIETIKDFSIAKHELSLILKQLNENDDNYNETLFEYNKAKSGFNSIYGMCVQKLVAEEYNIDDNFEWKKIQKTYKQGFKHIKRNFLFGLYTTAYARRNLIKAIVENCKTTFVYADTDSIKYINGQENFIDTNKIVREEFQCIPSICKLGTFEKDNEYRQFITYGAKKYAYTCNGDDSVHVTVAGLPKFRHDKGVEFTYKGIQSNKFDRIGLFLCGTEFINCKLGKKYLYLNRYSYSDINDNERFGHGELDIETVNFMNKNKIFSNGGVALYETSYTLDMSDSDKQYLIKKRKNYKLWLEKISDMAGIDLSKRVEEVLPIT